MRGFVPHITNNQKEMERKINPRVADLFSTIFLFKEKKKSTSATSETYNQQLICSGSSFWSSLSITGDIF